MKTISCNIQTLVFVVGALLLMPFTSAFAAINDCPFQASGDEILVHFPDTGVHLNFAKQPNRLLSAVWNKRPYKVDTAQTIPAGTYKVSLYAYDTYPWRNTKLQPRESFHVDFMQGNRVVARSGKTPDLKDYVKSASWGGVVNTELEISKAVTNVRAMHSAYPDKSNANSVNARCALLEPIVECPKEPYIAEVTEWSACIDNVRVPVRVRYETPTDCEPRPFVPPYIICDSIVVDPGEDDDDGGIVGTTPSGDDDTEDTSSTNPECSDGVDNDGDGAVDYPNDAGCTGSDDNDESDDAAPANPPTVTLEVSRDGGTGTFGSRSGADIVDLGGSEEIQLHWDSTHAATCSKTFIAGSAVDGTAQTVVEPRYGATINYVVSCVGTNGSRVSDSLSVTKPPTGPTITADDNSVHVGDDVTISWSTNNANPTACTMTETSNSGLNPAYATGLTSTSGSETLTINQDTVYTITCPGGTASTKVFALPKVYES